MRPDEHKKKRSTQYKKKHGIKPTDKNVGDKKTPGSETKNPAKGFATAAPSNFRPECVQTGSSSEDESKEIGPKKTFQRRKIESNWAKYEVREEEEDTNATLRGADFSELASLTSNSASQFRLEEEKGWEIDLRDSAIGQHDYLSVDCHKLSAAIQCVPLHTRLAIESQVFQAEQIKAFEEDAQIHKDTYLLTSHGKSQANKEQLATADTLISTNINSPVDKTFPVSSSENPAGICINNVMINTGNELDNGLDKLLDTIARPPQSSANVDSRFVNNISDTQSASNVLDGGELCESNANVPGSDDILDDLIGSEKDIPENHDIVSSTKDKDVDMLDDILSAGDSPAGGASLQTNKLQSDSLPGSSSVVDMQAKQPVGSSNINNTAAMGGVDKASNDREIVSKSEKVSTNIEDELDILLSLDDDGDEGGEVERLKTKKNISGDTKQAKNDKLEDWLDSMLDD